MSKFAKWLGGAVAALALGSMPANAQTPIKFTLDWVFQGPTSPFLVALEKGYYKAEGLDVTMDPGQGSAGAVQRVATGAYQIGFADVNATIEYNAKNPGKEVLCVFMAYDFAPFGVYALKKSGIKGPKDLEGKKLGAPVFDASFRLFPAFAKINGISKWEHVNLTPQLREQSLVQGTVDFISGHYFSSMLDLKARGVKFDDIVAMRYVDFGNAAGGRVVTAPTNGAAGIIPAVLHYLVRFQPDLMSDLTVQRFLLTAAAIGSLYKRNASISGAEVGCQGEVGVACSMAAGALTEVLGGTPRQVEEAAEIGMEHNLGLTCDPIKGLVQIPCIERNAMGAVKAINASRLALRGDGVHFVSLDRVIRVMKRTGADMSSRYKETSQGGLAVNISEC